MRCLSAFNVINAETCKDQSLVVFFFRSYV